MTECVEFSWRGFLCDGWVCEGGDKKHSPCSPEGIQKEVEGGWGPSADVSHHFVGGSGCVNVLDCEDGEESVVVRGGGGRGENLARESGGLLFWGEGDVLDSVSVEPPVVSDVALCVSERALFNRGRVSITQHTSGGPVTFTRYTRKPVQRELVSRGYCKTLENMYTSITQHAGSNHMGNVCERRRVTGIAVGVKVRITGASKKYISAVGLSGIVCDVVRPLLSKKVHYLVSLGGQCPRTVNSLEVGGGERQVVVKCYSSQIELL